MLLWGIGDPDIGGVEEDETACDGETSFRLTLCEMTSFPVTLLDVGDVTVAADFVVVVDDADADVVLMPLMLLIAMLLL